MSTAKNTPAASSSTGLLVLTLFTAVMLIAATYMAFFFAPTEKIMGVVQRIFYFHVGAAWAGALAFLVTVVAGIIYLARGKPQWDIVGYCSVEVGLALVTITITSGPVWAQFAWGKAWVWDPKLTSAAVMWLSYAAYLMLRQGIEDPGRRARFGAIYGIIAFASVIMTYFGVRFIADTIHPVVIGPSAGTPQTSVGMEKPMVYAMLFNFLTFTFVYATFLWHRIRLENLSQRVMALKMRAFARQEE
jgi:heme exporter protein C